MVSQGTSHPHDLSTFNWNFVPSDSLYPFRPPSIPHLWQPLFVLCIQVFFFFLMWDSTSMGSLFWMLCSRILFQRQRTACLNPVIHPLPGVILLPLPHALPPQAGEEHTGNGGSTCLLPLTGHRLHEKENSKFWASNSITVIFTNINWLAIRILVSFSPHTQNTLLYHFSSNFTSCCVLGELLVGNETWRPARNHISIVIARILSVPGARLECSACQGDWDPDTCCQVRGLNPHLLSLP